MNNEKFIKYVIIGYRAGSNEKLYFCDEPSEMDILWRKGLIHACPFSTRTAAQNYIETVIKTSIDYEPSMRLCVGEVTMTIKEV